MQESTLAPRGDAGAELDDNLTSAPAPVRRALDLLSTVGEQPIALTGDAGLVTALIADALQQGLELELLRHLGHGRWDRAGRGAANIRNGSYAKRVRTEAGTVSLAMPRDRQGSFDPVVVPKHGRRLPGPITGLAGAYASGLSRSEVRATLESAFESRLARDTLGAYVDELLPQATRWRERRLASAWPLLFVDEITLLGRGRRPSRRILDVVVGMDAFGGVQLLGLWRRRARGAGPARFAPVLGELHFRGIASVAVVSGADAESLAPAVDLVWPEALVRGGVDEFVQNALRGRS